MKLFLAIILIAVLSAVAEWLLPWWTVAIVSFVVSLIIRLAPGRSFVAGFLGVGVWWLSAACWQDGQNAHILSARMAALFHLPGYGLFIALTAVIGALVGGFAAWAGANPIKRRSYSLR